MSYPLILLGDIIFGWFAFGFVMTLIVVTRKRWKMQRAVAVWAILTVVVVFTAWCATELDSWATYSAEAQARVVRR